MRAFHVLTGFLSFALFLCPRPLVAQNPAPAPDLKALASLEPIDSHTHVAKGDTGFYALLERLHMHILDILLVDDHDPYRKALAPQLQATWRVVHDSHGHAALCTTIDSFQFGRKDFVASTNRGLGR